MSEIFSSLGLNAKLFIAQVINFCILLFVLYRFAYRPILGLLEERTKKIEKGIADAEASHQKLAEMTEREREIITEAKKQAKELIVAAEAQGQKNRDEIIAVAKEESAKLIKQAQKSIEESKSQMISEVKKEMAEVVIVAVEKVISAKLDETKDAKIINDALNN